MSALVPVGYRRVVVCGGRNFDDRELLWCALGEVRAGVVIQGGCPTGADRMAKQWAAFYRRECVQVDADWTAHGRAAGPMRNRRMARDHKAALVVASAGGAGTASMVREAEAVKLHVVRCSP